MYSEATSFLDRNPGESVRVVDAQPSAIRVLTGSEAIDGAAIGASIGRQLGYGNGDRISFGDGVSIKVDSVFPASPRSDGKSAWVYRSTGNQLMASKCIIETDPDFFGNYRSALPSMFPSAATLEFSTLNVNRQQEIEARWKGGLHRHAWLFSCHSNDDRNNGGNIS